MSYTSEKIRIRTLKHNNRFRKITKKYEMSK